MFRSCFCFFRPYRTQADLYISKAHHSDSAEIAAVAKQTFEDAYGRPYDPRNVAPLLKELNDKNCIFLTAKSQGKIIGYAKVLIIESEVGKNSAYLDKIYFLTSHQHRGYGKILLHRCFEEAVKLNASTMDLIVWDKNISAIRFYEKFNFTKGPVEQHYLIDGTPLEGGFNQLMHCKNIALNLQPTSQPLRRPA